MRWKSPLLALCLALAMAGIASAQEFRGRINGTVSDNTGAVLPGVTVTVSSPALIQPQEQITGADGQFRFPALPPGVYAVDFELSGFQNVKREGVRVVINQTLTVDQQLQVATLQETVTVSCNVATCSCWSTVSVWLMTTRTPSRLTFWKPASSKSMVYTPGGKAMKR